MADWWTVRIDQVLEIVPSDSFWQLVLSEKIGGVLTVEATREAVADLFRTGEMVFQAHGCEG